MLKNDSDIPKEKFSTLQDGSDDIVEKVETVKTQTSANIADNNVRTQSKLVEQILEIIQNESLGIACNIIESTNNHNGNRLFKINEEGFPFQEAFHEKGDDGQIRLTIMKDSTINIHLTVYGDNPNYIYYHAEGLNVQDFVEEMENLEYFLSTGEILEPSKLQKDYEYAPLGSKENLEAMIAFAEREIKKA